MHTATFKITSHMRSIILFLAAYIGSIFAGKDLFKFFTKDHTPPSYELLATMVALVIIALYINYLVGKIRLVVSDNGVAFTSTHFHKAAWVLAWKDVSECVLVCAPMGAHKILLKNSTKERVINLSMWELDKTTLNIQKDASPFFKYSRNKPPEEFALYKAIKHFQPAVREASSREATELIQKQLDLGKEAGIASTAAVLFVLLGLLVNLANKSRALDAGHLNIFCGIIAVIIGCYAFYYMRKGPQKFVNGFISLLVIGSSFWGIHSTIKAVTFYIGEEKTLEYTLEKDTFDHQEWTTTESPTLKIELYSDKDNRVYSNLHESKRLTIRKGVFGNYCISYETLDTFVKDPTKRRARRSTSN